MQEITLTQNTFKLFPTVYAVQNDTGRELKMIIQDQTLLLGDTGAVAVQRSDGSYYTIAATLNVLDNAFTADISQALTQPGRTLCQLKVTRSGLVVSSYTFCIMVQPSTDGINEAQLGYSVQQLRQDAEDIRTGGMPADLRAALLQIAQKVAYIDDQGAQYYQDLYDALAPSAILTGITAVYTQSGTVYDTDSLDDLKADLVVTASYSDGTTETLLASAYTLSGTLEEGTSTITVTYETQSETFSVTVSTGFLYTPDKGLLSAQEYITVAGDATVTETVANGELHLFGARISSGSKSRLFKFTPSTFATEAHLKAVVKFVDVPSLAQGNTTSQGYVTFRLSDGSKGASYGVARYNSSSAGVKGRVLAGASSTWAGDVTLNEWHTIEIDSTTTKQTVKVDGSTIVNNQDTQTLWVNYCTLMLYTQPNNDTDIYVKSIEFRTV